MKAIKFNGRLYNHLDELQQALHQLYNLVQDYPIKLQILEEIPSYLQIEWLLFFSVEFKDSINTCNNSFTSKLNYVFWRHLKEVLNNNKCCSNIINIVNTCMYMTPKVFCIIILLNTLSKLIKKVISKKLQVYTIVFNFIYPS